MQLKNIIYALRHITRYKEYSLLNVIGLSLGMASAILIMLWVEHEVRTDKFHANGKDIYMMRKLVKYSDGEISISTAMTSPFAPIIEKDIPEVEHAVRVTWEQELLFRLGDRMFYEKGHYADSSFFNVFSFPLVLGDPSNALSDPNNVVISEKLAEKYFGKENAMGKAIRIRGDKEEVFTVTGVCKESPTYSSLKFDFIIPYSKYAEYNKSWIGWGNFHMMTFVHAQPNVSKEIIESKINELYEKHGTWELPSFFLQSLNDIHLYSRYEESPDSPSGLILYVRIFSLVALFIIFLACMNYTNLATAIATRRGREVGVKKVFGSGRRFIFQQFIAEALTLTVLSFLLSIVIVMLALPMFNKLIDTNLTFDFQNYRIILIACLVPLFTGFLAGIFPAMYMSSFKPITVMKSFFNPRKGLPQLRQSLVVFQFVITIVFIISSLLIFKQIQFIQNKTLGLNEDNILFFPQSLTIQKHQETFKQELEKLPGVLSVCYTSDSPLQVGSDTSDPRWRGKSPDYNLSVPYIRVDHDFCETFNVNIIAGRDFNEKYPSDTNSVIINQKFAEIMGFEDPVGEVLEYWGRRANIIGVAKDFHIGGMRRPIQQLLIINRPSTTWITMVRVDGNMRQEAIKSIESTFRVFDETVPFEYEFVDEDYAKSYDSEKYLSRLAMLFTVLSIVISCLGLFGLALFTAEQRTKEIGIRKSIGAKTSQVMTLLTKKFLTWVILSFCIASVISYYVMQLWLESFAFRTDISWEVFLATGSIAVFIALMTVSWQAYRAANRNPVESLRYE